MEISSLGLNSLLSPNKSKKTNGFDGGLDQLYDLAANKAKNGNSKGDAASALLGAAGIDLSGLTLDSFEFSDEQSQFSIAGDNFAAQGASRKTSLTAEFHSGNTSYRLEIEVTQSIIGVAYNSAGGPAAADGAGKFGDLFANLPDDVKDKISEFFNGDVAPDYYSPDNTANRIADFALGGFANFGGGSAASENSEASRQRFADYILPAIDKGIADARKILGNLPEEISGNIDKTRDLIGKRFDTFVKGLNADA